MLRWRLGSPILAVVAIRISILVAIGIACVGIPILVPVLAPYVIVPIFVAV